MSSTGIERAELVFRRLRYAIVAFAILVGSISFGSNSTRWMALAALLHLMPALMQFVPRLSIAGAWLAVLLVSQAIVSLAMSSSELFSLPPNLSRRLEIPRGTVPGLSGTQMVSTDQNGFRVTKTIEYQGKPPGTVRIFAIGGSTTEQSLLDDYKTWTHLLQESLQAQGGNHVIEVINAGASGTRAIHHLASLRAIAAFQPDVVLLLVGINDWTKHIREHFGSDAYGRLSAGLWGMQLENTLMGKGIRAAFDAAKGRISGATLVEEAPMRGQTASIVRADTRKLRLEHVATDYAAVLEEIAAECLRIDTRCVLLTQPHAYREEASPELRRRFWMTPPFEDYTLDLESLAAIAETYNTHLLAVANEHGLGACDLASKMSSELDGFYDDCHFNEAGARAVAAGVAECLLADQAGPMSQLH